MVFGPTSSGGEDTRKNYIINGSMILAQRGTSFTSPASGDVTLDRWKYTKVAAVTHDVTQNTDVPTVAQADYLFQNSIRLNLTSADDSIAAGDTCVIEQIVEGYNWANLAQRTFTLSFWVKATTTGTYCVSFRNTGFNRSYVAEYTINTTDTWEKKIITVTASPSAGTWDYTNGRGIEIGWALAAGSTFQTTSGAWQTGNFLATSNQVNGVATGSTDFRITGVMLNEGDDAAPFSMFGKDIEGEIAAAQRYYAKSQRLTTTPGTGGMDQNPGIMVAINTTEMWGDVRFPVRMRSVPTVTVYDNANNAARIHELGVGDYANAVSVDRVEQIGIGKMSTTGITAGERFAFQWVANAEL